MLWAAATTTFFSFCRSGKTTVPGEAMYNPEVHLSYSDLAVDDALAPQAISIKIKTSKTDQCRRGYKVVLGRTNNCLCPVSALLSYLALYRNLPGPLFHWQNKIPLSKPKFVEHVRKTLLSANIPARLYAGQSFCIGAATTAATAGMEDSTIQTLGRWKSSSYLLYIRLNPHHMASLSSTLAQYAVWFSGSPSTSITSKLATWLSMHIVVRMYTIVFCLVYTAIAIYLSINNCVCMYIIVFCLVYTTLAVYLSVN